MRQIAERDLRRLAHNPAVVSLRAIVAVIADLRGGKGQLQQPCVKVLGLEHSATLSTNNLELIRGINRAGNLREVIGISNVIIEEFGVILLQPGEIFRNELLYQWVLALCKVLDQIFGVLASF